MSGNLPNDLHFYLQYHMHRRSFHFPLSLRACSVAAFATSSRVRRRPGDRRSIEAATALQQSLEAAVLVRLYPNSVIDVFVQVLQSDGGELAAAVNAATLALIDAGVAMSDYVVGCGVAYIQRTPLLGAADEEHNRLFTPTLWC